MFLYSSSLSLGQRRRGQDDAAAHRCAVEGAGDGADARLRRPEGQGGAAGTDSGGPGDQIIHACLRVKPGNY